MKEVVHTNMTWKNMIKLFHFALLFLLCGLAIGPSALQAQQTEIFTNEHRFYREAMDLFDKEKYAAAQKGFERYMELSPDRHLEQHINAEYHAALCALYLFHKDAEFRLEQFVLKHPESPWVRKVYFELATYNYKKKSYKKALEWFESVDPRDLNAKQTLEFHYKRGHALFMKGRVDEARTDFFAVKDEPGEYQAPANYFYSHIAYESEQWQNAYDGFSALADDENFGPVVPYYLSQILYKQGKYSEMLAYAPAFIDSTADEDIKRKPEIAQLIGDAYYRENNYIDALPYLEFYHQETDKADISRDAFFQLGYSYYSLGQNQKALDNLNEASQGEDLLAQSAIYHMADCYLKLDQKTYARSAFKEASEMDFNMELKEDALFNYAKLAYELSYNPFHEAITAFEEYLEAYPSSTRSDEAYEFLLQVYMKSKNYEKALASLDRIDNKDTRTKEAYQVVSFNRGVELFRAGKYAEAAGFFDKVSTYPVNPKINAEALFWKGELAYNSQKYSQALGYYNAFLQEPGSYNSNFYHLANYGAGYALFKQEKYIDASSAFRKFVDTNNLNDDKKQNDALLRVADCFYVSKSYDQAITYYERAMSLQGANQDYAFYQKAICFGLMGNKNKKIEVLKALLEDQDGSKFTADAKFELAKTYLSMDNYNMAKVYYDKILNEHGTSQYVKHSLVDLCLIEVKRGNNDEALALWNRIKVEYPTDQVALDAYNLVEPLLIENGLLSDLPPAVSVSDDDIEQKIFRAAEDYAITGDCNNAIRKLEEYLVKYQPGYYATSANYYLGNCYFERNELEKSLNAFNYVISQPVSDYSEEALVAAATMNYNKKNYQQALNHYIELENLARLKNNVLEAQIGQMRCHYLLGQKDDALEYAEKVISNENTPENIKITAYLWRGRIRFDRSLWDEAYYDFAEVVKTGGEKAAEAKYKMCEIAYNKGAYEAAEKEIFQMIENFSSYEEWKFKSYLLLSDVYVGMEDLFQARATLNTIIDNVSEAWVVDSAKQKLAALDQQESDQQNEDQNREIEINLQGEEDDNKSIEDDEDKQ